MATAAILGLDTALGAYLARLLDARGYRVRGTGSLDLLYQLSATDGVVLVDTPSIAAAGADEIYDLRYAPGLVLVDVPMVVAVDPADTRRREALTAERAAGRAVATAIIYPHESRLGPGTTPIARIVAAAAGGSDPEVADLMTNTDCGWTAEYVDALWRLCQSPNIEVAVATGHSINGLHAAHIAALVFGRALPRPVAICNASLGDTSRARADLGWRATTYGDDLIKVLCQGGAAKLNAQKN